MGDLLENGLLQEEGGLTAVLAKKEESWNGE
jgi:hypothetical protein